MAGQAKIALVVLLALALGTAASAQDLVTGKVYQVDQTDVYITLADQTAVRVPASTAQFQVHGVAVDWRDLKIGTPVDVYYTPVFGYQNYYLSSSSLGADDVAASNVTWVWRDGRWWRQ